MRKALITFILIFIFVITGFSLYPLTLVRVGYIELEHIVNIYTSKYLDVEISIREKYVDELQKKYSENYYNMSSEELDKLRTEISDQDDVLRMLKNNKFSWENNGELDDSIIEQIIQRDIMEAIKKTSEVEGFNLIIDNTGNFVYGSDDINLTDKVLFRLDEKLLDLQSSKPLAPLSLELEEEESRINKPENATQNTNKNE